MPRFSFTEPHPTVPKSGGYIYGGRGGAGNYQRYDSSELTPGPTATGPASRANLTKPTRRTVAAGRGGAGNMFSETEESIFQFDEELLKQRDSRAPVYHIGRGGAANWVDESKPRSERKHSSSSSAASTHSADSTASAARRSAERVLGVFGRRPS